MILLALACTTGSSTPDRPFELPVRDRDRVRFVAVGDVGKLNDGQREVARGIAEVCAREVCDFVFLLGDNLYPDGMVSPGDPRMDEAMAPYDGLGIPIVALLGNHDWGRKHLTENARFQLDWASKHALHMPERFFRFQAGTAELWAMDTDTLFWESDPAQLQWLDRTLARSEAQWRVVFGHHPYRSNGKHGNAGSYEGWSLVPYMSGGALRAAYEDHIVGKAQLALAGHDHNLQSMTHEGLELVVSGAGASARPLVDRGNALHQGHALKGFAWVELGERGRIRFHDHRGQLLSERVFPRTEIQGHR